MVGEISDPKVVREMGVPQTRPQVPPASPAAQDPATALAQDKRLLRLEEAIGKLVKQSLPASSKLQIEQDEETGAFIYRSVDPETGEVLRQWPSEDILKLRASLRDMEGLLVDKKA
jgi:flagellar protein FlaG